MIDLSQYINKQANDQISAEQWNAVFTEIQEAINEHSISEGVTEVLIGDDSCVVNGVAFVPKGVNDVKVNGISVLENGIANINLDSKTVSDGKFYVNDIERSIPASGIVTLSAGNTYRLRGTLNGQIIIGSINDLPDSGTNIVLDGLYVKTNAEDAKGISYEPNSKTLTVTLTKGTFNSIECLHEAEMAESQKASLYSEKNMIIQGAGTLVVKNKGGHGIKASELRIWGKPVITASAIHDAIHGNSSLEVYDGTIFVNGANDALGTGTTGKIMIFGGEIDARNVNQNVLDSKEPGYVFNGATIKCTGTDLFNNVTKIIPEVYFGNATVDTINGGFTIAPTGTVVCYSDADMTTGATEINSDDGIYTLTSAYARVRGYVEGKIVAGTQSTDISFYNAYLKGSIEYTPSKKKLQITAEAETINFIESDSVAVTSNSNAAIEFKDKAFIGIKAKEIGLSGDEITLNDADGVLTISDCQIGIKGKDIYIGTAATPKTIPDTMKGAIILNNTTDIDAILNSKFVKGAIKVVNDTMPGILIANTINVAGQANFDNCERVYYNVIKGNVIKDPGETKFMDKFTSL